MPNAVAERNEVPKIEIAEAPPGPALDIDALVASETEALERLYKERHWLNALKPRWPIPDYLRRVIDLHAPVLERFGGWRWHSGPLEALAPDANLIRRTIDGVVAAYNGLQLPDGSTLQFRAFETLADEQYCGILGCHKPMPRNNNLDLYRSAVYEPQNEQINEMSIEYASRKFVKIRRGQKVSKAVLSQVRKDFKGEAEHIQMYEKIMERMGQIWAGSTGMGLTYTVAPSDILRFGHLGENSCFANGHQHEQSKLNLTLLDNTFGIYIYSNGVTEKRPPSDKPRDTPPNGRAFGVLVPEAPGVVLSNLYLLDWTRIRPSIKLSLEQLFPGHKFAVEEKRLGTLFPLGGKLTMDHIPHEKIKVYVNADTHIVAAEGQAPVVHAKAHGWAKKFAEDSTRQHLRVRCSCGQYVTDLALLVQCACGRNSCPACMTECQHCHKKECNNCAMHNRVRCGGCRESFCRNCVEEHPMQACEGCGVTYCEGCTERHTTRCCVEGCEQRICQNCGTSGCVGEGRVCADHAETHLRQCTRCQGWALLAHVTRCPMCKTRRCDNCREEGEGVDPRSPCRHCQARGVDPQPAPQGEPDAAVLARFQNQLVTLDPEIRAAHLPTMRLYEWTPVPADQ